MRRRLALYIFMLLAVPAAADPLSTELKRLSNEGWEPAEKVSARLPDKSRLVAMTLRQREEEHAKRFRVYRVLKNGAKLIYLEPSSSMRLALSSIHEKGEIPALAEDGLPILSYSLTFPGLGRQTLIVLRWNGSKLERLADFPFAAWEDLNGDGRLELLSRDRPLGQFFALECASFRTMAQSAFQTRIYSWRGSRLVPNSGAFPGYFARHIEELERDLAGQDPRVTQSYGGYLGSALSLYFDHHEIGQGREGWRKFVGLFPIRPTDPGPVRRCMRDMEDTLRTRLRIPPDW